jgi:hypothetical protein
MAPLQRPPGRATASLLGLITVAIGVLTGCGDGPTDRSPDRRGGPRIAVPTPDLCKQLDRSLVTATTGGKVTGCTVRTVSPDEHLVRFSSAAKAGKKDKDADEDAAATAQLTIAYRLRYDPKSGRDRWPSLSRPEGTRRVPLLGAGDDAIFDYRAGWPDLSLVKGDLIILITHEASGDGKPEKADDDLPSALTELANKVTAATR